MKRGLYQSGFTRETKPVEDIYLFTDLFILRNWLIWYEGWEFQDLLSKGMRTRKAAGKSSSLSQSPRAGTANTTPRRLSGDSEFFFVPVFFVPSTERMRLAHTDWGELPASLIQMLTSSRHTAPGLPRVIVNQVPRHPMAQSRWHTQLAIRRPEGGKISSEGVPWQLITQTQTGPTSVWVRLTEPVLYPARLHVGRLRWRLNLTPKFLLYEATVHTGRNMVFEH